MSDLTDLLRKPQGEWSLLPGQERSLVEAKRAGGLIASLPVGSGKTLLSALLPTYLDCARPFVFTRAALVEKTHREFEELKRHWRIRGDIYICSYEDLSSQRFADLLEHRKPDLIVCDEAHCLKNVDSARTKRFLRYCASYTPTLCLFSGTLMSASIEDLWHLSLCAFPDSSPLPTKWAQAQNWAAVLDRDSFMPTGAQLAQLSWLAAHSTLPEHARLQQRIQDGFRHWIAQQPGFVYEFRSSCSASLSLEKYKLHQLNEETSAAIERLDELWQTPDGEDLFLAFEHNRIRRQLECGFYYRWVWPNDEPDRAWQTARNEFRKELRAVLSLPAARKAHVDSMAQGEKYLRQTEPNNPMLLAWDAQKHKPEPPRETVWLDKNPIKVAVELARKENAILWCTHQAQLDAAAKLGLEAYGGGQEFDESTRRPLALSIKAHGTGRNLQAWDVGVVPSPPTNQVVWQQLIGRCHREGQRSDLVRWLVPGGAYWNEILGRARKNAEWAKITSGEEQKLLLADSN